MGMQNAAIERVEADAGCFTPSSDLLGKSWLSANTECLSLYLSLPRIHMYHYDNNS